MWGPTEGGENNKEFILVVGIKEKLTWSLMTLAWLAPLQHGSRGKERVDLRIPG